MADGILPTILALVDQKKQAVKRSVSDAVSNPQDYLNKVMNLIKESGLQVTQTRAEAQKIRQPTREQIDDVISNMLPAPVGMMVGTKSANPIIQAALEKGQQMALDGASKEEIFAATKRFISPGDRQARVEISDLPAKLTRDISKSNGQFRLGDLLDHPELYASYPDLKNITVTGKNFRDAGTGTYKGKNPYTKTEDIDVGTAGDSESILSGLLHEIQHAIQGREDFARGGSKAMFDKESAYYRPEFESHVNKAFAKKKQLEEAVTQAEAEREAIKADPNSTRQQRLDASGKTSSARWENLDYDPLRDLYRRLSGEAEARTVEYRRANPILMQAHPEQSYDVPLEELINKF